MTDLGSRWSNYVIMNGVLRFDMTLHKDETGIWAEKPGHQINQTGELYVEMMQVYLGELDTRSVIVS